MAHLGFNAASVDPAPARGLMPKGRYIVICEKSEVKPTQKGTGHVLLLVFSVVEGEYKKKKIFDYVNIQNENPVAQRIGQQHLAAFCNAVGISQLDNSFQLHGIPVEVEVGVKEGTNGFEAKNVIRGFVKKVAEAGGGINLSQTLAPPVESTGGVPNGHQMSPQRPTVDVSNLDDDIPF